jgi:hypothetical protein
MHRVRLLAAAALLVVAVAAPVRAGQAGDAGRRLQLPAHSTLDVGGARSVRRADWAGGVFTTQTGERVSVLVSRTYANPEAIGLRWASFLSSLLHGSELALVRAHVAPLPEVEEFCEARALGCYGANTLVSIGDPVDGVTAEEVMRHEYGHHVAANRQNPPWAAIDWGTKRWASAADVCTRVAGQTAFPGDEGLYYTQNPGEAFAEAYRVLNEVRSGAPNFSWTLADASFSPDERELAAIEDDVLRPWAPSPLRVVAGRFRGGARTWTQSLPTLLDGDLELSLRMPLGAGHTLDLLDSRGVVVARGLWSGSGVRTLRYRICGQRSVRIRVGRAGGPQRFQVRVRVP